jgi:hypothetical protein
MQLESHCATYQTHPMEINDTFDDLFQMWNPLKYNVIFQKIRPLPWSLNAKGEKDIQYSIIILVEE